MKIIISVFLLFASQSLFANQSKINTINKLAKEIRIESDTTEASEQALDKVIEHMSEALDLLKQNSGGFNKECFDYAYAKYFQSNSSSTATDKALALCKKINDFDILKFSYDKYFQSNSSDSAMNKAGDVASKPLKGKLDMLSFAYDKYFQSNSSESAMNKSADGISKVPQFSLQCLQDLYSKYFQSNSSETAMNKAIASCGN